MPDDTEFEHDQEYVRVPLDEIAALRDALSVYEAHAHALARSGKPDEAEPIRREAERTRRKIAGLSAKEHKAN
jgi:hypothetical protein